MSVYFDVADRTVWNPSNAIGALYLKQAAAIGEQFALDPGLPFASDEVAVDLDRFVPFARRLLAEYAASDHDVWRALVAGVLGPAVVMVDRAGAALEPGTPAEADVLHWAHGMFGGLPA
jgi:hypothetical protein